MIPSILTSILFLSVFFANALSSGDGYVGYNLTMDANPEDLTYDTTSTPANVSTTDPAPDVFLNASVHVGEIDITVANLTAKLNLDAQVLKLLKFNAGVDLSIDKVELLIQNISAEVTLEARLENLVLMIGDILNSLDLNPVLATLGTDLVNITNTTVGAVTGALGKRDQVPLSYDLAHNVLYSTNNYEGRTHTNRILEQDGSIVDQKLDNDGDIESTTTVGSYMTDMTFNGDNQTATFQGEAVHKLEYVYTPFNGLSVVSNIYVNAQGGVVGTRVLSELSGGGSSTIGD